MATSTINVLLTFAFETLEDVRRREFCRPPDQLLLEIVRDTRAHDVVVADPWRSRIADVVRGRPRRDLADVTVGDRPVRHVRPMRLRFDDATDVSALRNQYERYGHLVRKRIGPVDAVITAHPFIAAWAARFMGERCLYYARDDWAGHQNLQRWWPALDLAQHLIGWGEHEIFAVSRTLGDRLRPDGAVTVVPNGISSDVWRERQDWPLPNVPRPERYAIYSGSINSRLDLDLMERIAHHPRLDAVVMAGPVESTDLGERLARIRKAIVLGDLDQQTLAAVTSNAAVGVLPHVTSRQTTASSPLKVYEYLAGGLPVVTIDLASVDNLGDRVHLCQEAAEWWPALDRALDQGHAAEPQRRDTVEALSWQRRLRPIVDSALRVDKRSARER